MKPLLALAFLSSVTFAADPVRLVEIPLGACTPEQLAAVYSTRVGLDHVEGPPRGGRLQALATDPVLAALDDRAIPYDVRIADLTSYYVSRFDQNPAGSSTLGSTLTPAFGAGSMGGFYTWSEVVSVLDQLRTSFPSLITAKTSLGTTIQGRDIWAVKISDNPEVDENEPEARFDSMHHAREPQSMQSTLWFMLFLLENYGSDPLATYLVNEREMWFVPVVNPDGFVYNETNDPAGGGLWRKNRRNNGGGDFGVDPNRNYPFQWGYDDFGSSDDPSSEVYRGPSPASEAEVQAMMAFATARSFRTALSSHSFSNVWFYPFGYDFLTPPNSAQYDEISALATATSGYPYGPGSVVLYPANGVTIDWDQGAQGILSWTPEIGSDDDGFWPETDRIVPLAEETLEGFQSTALAAGAFVHASSTIVDAGNGDGFFLGGEDVHVEVTARNSGLDATTGSVTATLATSSPNATVTGAAHDFGSVASFSDESSGASLAMAITPGTPPGTRIDYTLEISYEGYTQSVDDSFVVGENAFFIADAVEIDYGWTAGVPGDGAETGIWERGNPNGTESNGVQYQPEDDSTPAPGTDCFVTGNGGGSAGDDDVDEGPTTLLTPVFDLSGIAGSATVGYDRWFAISGSDVLEVSISNDAGGSWTPLETVDDLANAWTTVEFTVEDFLAQTDRMQLRFVTADSPNNSLVEAAIDELAVRLYYGAPRMNVYGTPALSSPISVNVVGRPGDPYSTFYSLGTAQIPVEGVVGDLLIDPLFATFLLGGVIPAERVDRTDLTVPSSPGLQGVTVYCQSLMVSGGETHFTNRSDILFVP